MSSLTISCRFLNHCGIVQASLLDAGGLVIQLSSWERCRQAEGGLDVWAGSIDEAANICDGVAEVEASNLHAFANKDEHMCPCFKAEWPP